MTFLITFGWMIQNQFCLQTYSVASVKCSALPVLKNALHKEALGRNLRNNWEEMV